jgi:ABC-type multidrug transport system fused ATPase/permease subunit
MDKGLIVEQGTHEQLLEQNGYYSNLYEMQFKKQAS